MFFYNFCEIGYNFLCILREIPILHLVKKPISTILSTILIDCKYLKQQNFNLSAKIDIFVNFSSFLAFFCSCIMLSILKGAYFRNHLLKRTFKRLISLVSILINHQLKGVSDDQ